ncbi:hypothetical protein GCM10023331_10610 [Algivirga pacifica]|uniref:Uncharacterized protein n=2 Tax=Algivirga pacifica TaxID=1162670 RepID=A0ABP9D3Y1_9BACT
MGLCNCGHLAQELTNYTQGEIHHYALRAREGDWADQVAAFCPQSKLPMDLVITKMLEAGLTTDDLKHLERLTDPEILSYMGYGEAVLQHNRKEDVLRYMMAWANMLEEELVKKEKLSA